MPIKNKILADIRSDVCDTVLGWTLVAGAVAIAISLSRIIQFGWLPVMGLHIGLEIVLIPIYYFRKRIPFAVRASAILAVMYLVGIGGHISFGTPTRIEFFVSASIMAAVFFGERAGLISAGTTILCIAAIYAAFCFNLIPQPMTAGYAMSATSWITNAASSLVAALAPLVAVTRYRNHLELERQRAEAANAAKSDFLAMMSHELRTPMTAILGISDLLLSEQLSADLTNKISWISKSGRLLLGLLNDVLDFSKIEANHLAIEQSVFHPRELFRDIQNLFTPLAAEKKLILHVDFADNLEDRLISDASRLRQVVVNLVGNAVKFTEHGRVDVRVAQEYQNGNQLMLTVHVSDTGIGISRQQQAQLFQPFMQANRGTARRYGGTGLGLAISRRIVELMGGHITVTSEEHQGTTFMFSVPVLEDMEESALSLLSKPSHPPQNPPQGLRILVAEDDETIAFLLQTMLVRWGNTVDVVGDGGAAVTAAQSQAYDIVLMDMQMPNVDGASATRAIRQLGGVVRRDRASRPSCLPAQQKERRSACRPKSEQCLGPG